MCKKKMGIFLLVFVMLFTILPHSFAATTVPNDEMRKIALNAPVVFGYNYEWQISKETVLYNSTESIVAVCFDMKNTDEIALVSDTSDEVPATAYAIINTDETGNPILLFGVFGISPYYDGDFNRAYYLGSMEYYAEKDGVYTNLSTNDSAEYETFSAVDTSIVQKKSYENYSAVRAQFLNPADGPSILATNGSKILSGVPNLQWRKGCAPTTVAMLISTKYSVYNTTTMIDSLATSMGTNPSTGGTGFAGVVSGTKSYIKSNSNMVTPAFCGWPSANSNNVPYTGLSNNTKDAFQSSINAGYPVGVGITSSNVTTPGFPNGIGGHMMAGIGYSFAASGDYIICHTTNVADGNVYFPLTDQGLHDHYWLLLLWTL